MVLLVTFSQDHYTIDLVRESLTAKGIDSVRLNTDDFPMELSMNLRPGSQEDSSFRIGDRSYSRNSVQGVWMRRFWPATISEELDPQFRASSGRESNEVMEIFLSSIRTPAYMDPLTTVRRASNKHLQLDLAVAAGISIPHTLTTNDAGALREFHELHGGRIIGKMLTPLTAGMQASSFFMYTNLVTPDCLEEAESLVYCPMTFQRLIEKEYELRIIYVDGYFFSGKIDASQSLLGKIDWRRATPSEASWEPYEAPAHLRGKITKLMNSLGLLYGAIDVIRETSGEYIFLEVNPSGEWGMIQKFLNCPIAEAIAEALAKRM